MKACNRLRILRGKGIGRGKRSAKELAKGAGMYSVGKYLGSSREIIN